MTPDKQRVQKLLTYAGKMEERVRRLEEGAIDGGQVTIKDRNGNEVVHLFHGDDARYIIAALLNYSKERAENFERQADLLYLETLKGTSSHVYETS